MMFDFDSFYSDESASYRRARSGKERARRILPLTARLNGKPDLVSRPNRMATTTRTTLTRKQPYHSSNKLSLGHDQQTKQYSIPHRQSPKCLCKFRFRCIVWRELIPLDQTFFLSNAILFAFLLSSNFKFFVPLILASVAILLGTAPSLQCETLQFAQVDEYDEGLILLAGPFSYRTKNSQEWSDATFAAQTCNNYGRNGLGFDYEKDAKTNTVWAFSIITPVIGACIILKSFFRITCGGGGYQWMGYSYIITAFFQGLVLLANSSSLCDDNPALQYLEANNADLAGTFSSECQIATGYVLQAIAVALWILAAVAEFWAKDPVLVFEYPSQEQLVTYTQNTDGVAQETNVTIVKGTAVEQPEQ